MAQGGARKLSPVAQYVAERTGSSLSVQQVSRLQGLLDARLGARTEDQYLMHLRSPAGAAELAELMAAIAVHKTDLFRDEVQLRAFDQAVLRPLARASSRPLHLWSAGCATGEEVATLLILLAEAGAHSHSTVLGSDISETALRQARSLSFHPSALKRIPERLRERYFVPAGGQAQLVPELRERATFVQHNLMDSPYPASPSGQGFDVIFCRNVIIYLSESATERVVGGLTDRLKVHGTLVLSAAEPLIRPKGSLGLVKCNEAFFYARQPEPPPPPSSVRTPMPPARPPLYSQRHTPLPFSRNEVRTPATPEKPMPVVVVPPAAPAPAVEARQIFELVLEGAEAGDPPAQTEEALRKCLYLDPHFAQARYVLGTLLEQRGELAAAATEYRRALAALRDGRSRPTPFYLNDERLKIACERALARLGYPAEP